MMGSEIKISAISTCYKNGFQLLPAFFESVVSQVNRERIEVVLVHYNPTEEEQRLVKNFQSKYPNLLNYIVGPKENVASAMNRAIRAAKGEYLCIWNIDDLRTENSLALEQKVLDDHPEISFTYGDFIMVNQWGKKDGRYINLPEFEKREGIRSMVFGPYYMWRRKVNGKIGLFDEQFNSAADFDFSARLSVEYQGKKCAGLLGYYLDIGGGISTARGALPEIERTVIELRYGAYRKVDFIYIPAAKRYHLNEILNENKWININDLVPNRKKYLDSGWWWLYAVIRYPFWLIQRVINKSIRIYYQKFY